MMNTDQLTELRRLIGNDTDTAAVIGDILCDASPRIALDSRANFLIYSLLHPEGNEIGDITAFHESVNQINANFAETFAAAWELCHIHSCDIEICEDDERDECAAWRAAL